ncbi:MAG: PAS domain S-box protein [Deltaproteobacteria bacterium]|nr:PAS domain S-box protein [Deltaproteobacteria bacterium]MBW2122081.1 PAS domain S-box protein [Deltaproteobacteria bacterium]
MAARFGYEESEQRAGDEVSKRPRRLEELVKERTAELQREIDRRKKTEAELRKLSRAVEESPASVVITDTMGTIEYVNKKFARLTGYTAGEAIGQNPSILKSGRQSPGFYQELWETITHGNEWRGEFLNKKKNGDLYWEAASISPIKNDRGTITHFVGVKEDITDRKGAEEALRRAHEELEQYVKERTEELVRANEQLRREVEERKRAEDALRESEARFRQLAENIEDVFWLRSADLTEVFYVSPAYEKVWGRTCRSLYDRHMIWFEGVHPDDREHVKNALMRVRVEESGFEHRIVRPDGSARWVRIRSFPIRDESGKVYRIAGIASDVTEEKRLRQESERRQQQIIQADRLSSLGQVVAGVAHEINNPNSFITYNTPLLEETWRIFEPILREYSDTHPGWQKDGLGFEELLEDMREIIRAIRIGSERINRVVSDLKDFARMDESVHTRPVQVNEVVEKTLRIVGAQLRKSVGEIEIRLGEGLPEIDGHLQKLEQVVANLLVNASQAVPDKARGKVSIRTRYLERLRAVLIEVEDNGRGMEAKVVDRIFDPFFTTRREERGTGLGLSVSHGLVEEHRGVIGVLSRPGRGSRFTVFLPVERDSQLHLEPTILSVRDNGKVQGKHGSLRAVVGAGWVEIPLESERVMEYLEGHPEVDTVLFEIVPPGMTGWELAVEVESRFPLVAVVLHTRSPDALKRGPDGIFQSGHLVQEPVETDRLLQVVGALGRQRL